ncbi:hypothetical protein F441_03221 [Phytophthora nicotianae CJ01A1]|uniref:Uncharacterized protein n=4 Tax=Phytophthora nicotianae TaxID=4792 RepID=V9FS54_PHYNI|nr:hypothetical protein F443_03236 [Phytophthora nicotianae P1569]ETO82526.1 hypothetical protein F444_03303 [Phytophthora nicotianae P1976]ETP23711.1 hypothetical protein F441_03221 [Phytophthora nicotianae CJ01A1]ETP51677.1 hypothetical protein F442_03217 [Phytophthora nicotianae P10297]
MPALGGKNDRSCTRNRTRQTMPCLRFAFRQQANLRAQERAANAFPSAGESSFVMTHAGGRATSRASIRSKASVPRRGILGCVSRLAAETRRPRRNLASVDKRIFRIA